jgi:uncharacterized membrane protein
MDQHTIEEGKTIAIISYITLIGTLVAYLMNNNKKNEFAKFHIGQALRAWLTGIVVTIVANILVSITDIGFLSYLSYTGLVLAIIGLVNAMNGELKKIPIVGEIGG